MSTHEPANSSDDAALGLLCEVCGASRDLDAERCAACGERTCGTSGDGWYYLPRTLWDEPPPS